MSVYLKLNELENRLTAAENTIDAGVSNDGNLTVTGQLTVGAITKNHIITGYPVFRDDRYSVGSNVYSGIGIQNLGDSTSIQRVGFIDFINYRGYQDASIFVNHEIDGSAIIRFLTTPAGDKGADRRYLNPEVIISGGNIVMANGQGISFAATGQPAGMTSETLTDYEEGTWVATMGGSCTIASYQDQSGSYTKVGNLVTFTCRLSFNGTSTGAVYIDGLPYTAGDNNRNQSSVSVAAYGEFTGTNYYNMFGYVEKNTTKIYIYTVNAAGLAQTTQLGSSTTLKGANNANTMVITGQYMTS